MRNTHLVIKGQQVIVWFLDNSITRKSPGIQGKTGFLFICVATGTPALQKAYFFYILQKKA
jgi:hypothetical protein